MAKSIQLSADDTTYYTLPGSSGEVTNEAGQLPDTIFGQEFSSNFPGLIGWQVQGNAVLKGFAGYQVGLKITGTSTVMTAEDCTVTTGLTYQIDDDVKQIIDRAVTFIVLDNAVAVAAVDIESVDYLFGKVTFVSGYTVAGDITMTGAYLPTATVAGARTFTLQQTSEAIDETDIATAQTNSGHRVFDYGLKSVSIDISGVYSLSNDFLAKLKAREEFIVEINPDGAGLAAARGFFRFATQGQAGNVGELEEENISLVLSVPDVEKLVAPFIWNIDAASTLSPAVKEAIIGWQTNTLIFMRYLPDGVTGVTGEVVVTDLSIAGGLESMNDFTVNLQGSGEITAI